MRYVLVILVAFLACGCAFHPGDVKVVPPEVAYNAAPDPVLACKLLRAAQCAYAVKANGEFAGDDAKACAPWTDRRAIASGVEQIDAVVAAIDDEALIIAFRGTLPFEEGRDRKSALRDWIQDAHNGYVVEPNVAGHVHRGFRAAVSATWGRLLAVIREWKEQGRLEGKKIYVTGHSKGGSAALIAAVKLDSVGFKPDAVYTYAAARAGDEEFAKSLAASGLRVWRYENHLDVVPRLPPNSSDGKLLGTILQMENVQPADEYHPSGLLMYVYDGEAMTAEYDDLDHLRVMRFERFMGRRDIVERVAAAHSSRDDGEYYRAICGAAAGGAR